jgi:L-asparaginase/Glu-tRNA(Gln) amidotransferase subunit D
VAAPANSRRRVGLVLTGGTIAAEPGAGGALAVSGDSPGTAEVGLLAAAAGPGADLDVVTRSPVRLLSENLEPADWIPIATAVRELAETEAVTGVVVFHGTDTMAYTAAALSYLLSDLDKPVVLTGSNLPPNQPGSDAIRNAEVALAALAGLAPGTYVAFAGEPALPGLVHLGTRVRKRQASGQTYASVHGEPVGRVEAGRFEAVAAAPAPSAAGRGFHCRVEPRVMALRLHPGLDFEVAFGAVLAGECRGVVVELYASATGPDTDDAHSLPRFIRRCGERGVPVLTTVNIAPGQEGNPYETTVAVAEAGGVFLEGMLPETAIVKLMWALAQHDDADDVKRLMATPIAGDMPAKRTAPAG